jgi:N-acetylglucosaminyldiphosphoundecaprenol N-acetyl-beta-D-mannosaminyltransferase
MKAVESIVEGQPTRFRVLGVGIDNLTRREAIARIDEIVRSRPHRAAGVFFVNAHTLNLAAANAGYRLTLNAGDLVLADGTGVRWSAGPRGCKAFGCGRT